MAIQLSLVHFLWVHDVPGVSIGLLVKVRSPRVQDVFSHIQTCRQEIRQWSTTHLVGLLPAVAGDQVLDLLLHIEDAAAATEEGGNSPNPLKCTQWNTLTEECLPLTALQSHILRAPFRSNKPGGIPENELNTPKTPKSHNAAHSITLSLVLLWWIFIQLFSFWGERGAQTSASGRERLLGVIHNFVWEGRKLQIVSECLWHPAALGWWCYSLLWHVGGWDLWKCRLNAFDISETDYIKKQLFSIFQDDFIILLDFVNGLFTS